MKNSWEQNVATNVRGYGQLSRPGQTSTSVQQQLQPEYGGQQFGVGMKVQPQLYGQQSQPYGQTQKPQTQSVRETLTWLVLIFFL